MKKFEIQFSVIRPVEDIYSIEVEAENIDEANILFDEITDKLYEGKLSLYKDCEYIDTPDNDFPWHCIEDIELAEIKEIENE